MEWTNEVTIEFLDLYESEPSIWNPQNEYHKDRNEVYDAWKRIQAQFSIECSVKDLKRKKENLMSTFRKLSGKVRRSATTSCGTSEVYKPEWFAYEKMAAFLHTVYGVRGTATTERLKEDYAFGDDNPQDNEDEPFNAVHDEVESSSSLRNWSNNNDREVTENLTVHKGGPLVGEKRKSENETRSAIEKRMDKAYDFLQQVAKKEKTKKGESQLFCDLLCARLEALDEHRRDFVMHEITNLMYHAKNSSYLSNATSNQPFYQHHCCCHKGLDHK